MIADIFNWNRPKPICSMACSTVYSSVNVKYIAIIMFFHKIFRCILRKIPKSWEPFQPKRPWKWIGVLRLERYIHVQAKFEYLSDPQPLGECNLKLFTLKNNDLFVIVGTHSSLKIYRCLYKINYLDFDCAHAHILAITWGPWAPGHE